METLYHQASLDMIRIRTCTHIRTYKWKCSFIQKIVLVTWYLYPAYTYATVSTSRAWLPAVIRVRTTETSLAGSSENGMIWSSVTNLQYFIKILVLPYSIH